MVSRASLHTSKKYILPLRRGDKKLYCIFLNITIEGDTTAWRNRRSLIPSPAARGLVTIVTELSMLLRMFINGKHRSDLSPLQLIPLSPQHPL